MSVTRNGGKRKAKSVTVVAEAARRLGVTRTHLSLVLHGHRASRRLMLRYRELKRAALAEAAR